MTDRIRTVIVVLDRDYREDDAEPIVKAIRMIKGVASVELSVVDGVDHMARMVARTELQGKVEQAVANVFNDY